MTTFTRRLTLALTALLFVGALVAMTTSPARSDTPVTDQQTYTTCDATGTTTTTVYLIQASDGSWSAYNTVQQFAPVTCVAPPLPVTAITDPRDYPYLPSIVMTMVTGSKRVGFDTWTTTNTRVTYPPQRYMVQQCRLMLAHSAGRPWACAYAWRDVYASLAEMRDWFAGVR